MYLTYIISTKISDSLFDTKFDRLFDTENARISLMGIDLKLGRLIVLVVATERGHHNI
jgi:hypothetical protein